MSLSKEQRAENLHTTLVELYQYAGDNRSTWCYINSSFPYFDSVLPTTWKEMEMKGFVKVVHPGHSYQLQPGGWLAGLLYSNVTHTPDFRQNLGKLLGALKDRVKGRHQDGFADVHTIEKETGLPVGFIQNAIDCRLIERVFKKQGDFGILIWPSSAVCCGPPSDERVL